MSEKKKLTDEEIVKALECMTGVQLRDCDNCPFMDGNFCDDFAIARNARDLIHRLQNDYSNLKERYVKVLDLNEKVIAEQKAEIERLTEKRDKLFNANVDTQEELNKVRLDRNRENTELQKQINELIEKSLLKCEYCPARRDLGLLLYQNEQAVKDTAKEILQIIKDEYDYIGNLEKRIKERYGVEVEMMEYKRLTRRNEDGTTWVKCAVCDIQDKCDFTKECCCQELQDRLAELEDKIEQGTLVQKEDHDVLQDKVKELEIVIKEAQVAFFKALSEESEITKANVEAQCADRIQELEEALLDMVAQFCEMGEKGKLCHTFMSAEEQAFDVLGIKYGEDIDEVYKRFNDKWNAKNQKWECF